MAHIKKRFLKIIFASMALTTLHPMHAISNQAWGMGFAATSIGLAVMNEELAEAEWFEKFANKINVNKDDLAPCMVFGSALWAASFIPDGSARHIMRIGAVLPVLAAACLPRKAINKLAQLPGIKQYFALMKQAKGIPFIGDYAQCSQLGCQGLCSKCKARKLYLTVPLMAIPFVPTIIGSFQATIARWERERIEQDKQDKAEREREADRRRDEDVRRQQEQNARKEGEIHADNQETHYDVLDVYQNDTPNDIRRAYHRLARQAHPDKAEDNGISKVEANQRMARINAANEILSDPDRKREYDFGLRHNNPRAQRPNQPNPAPAAQPGIE